MKSKSFQDWLQQTQRSTFERITADEFDDYCHDRFCIRLEVGPAGLIYSDNNASWKRPVNGIACLEKEYNQAYHVRYNDDILSFLLT